MFFSPVSLLIFDSFSLCLCIFSYFTSFLHCSVHAYIVFKDEQSAKAALSHNMAQVG